MLFRSDMASAASNARCALAATTADTALTSLLAAPQWNGWGAGPAQRRYQTAAMAGLAAADVPKLELKWAFGFEEGIGNIKGLVAWRNGRHGGHGI